MCLGVANPSGWINVATLLELMKYFIQNVKCSPANPVLLLLDNHESHVSIPCLDLAQKNGITMLSFAPHSSHMLQPLDWSVYGPLKRYYNAVCDDWVVSNPRPMTIYDCIAAVASKAYAQVFTASNISVGFAKMLVTSVSAIFHVPAFNHSMSSVTINIAHQASLKKIKPFPKARSRKSVKGHKRHRTLILRHSYSK